jgi:hypothetical protein
MLRDMGSMLFRTADADTDAPLEENHPVAVFTASILSGDYEAANKNNSKESINRNRNNNRNAMRKERTESRRQQKAQQRAHAITIEQRARQTVMSVGNKDSLKNFGVKSGSNTFSSSTSADSNSADLGARAIADARGSTSAAASSSNSGVGTSTSTSTAIMGANASVAKGARLGASASTGVKSVVPGASVVPSQTPARARRPMDADAGTRMVRPKPLSAAQRQGCTTPYFQ